MEGLKGLEEDVPYQSNPLKRNSTLQPPKELFSRRDSVTQKLTDEVFGPEQFINDNDELRVELPSTAKEEVNQDSQFKSDQVPATTPTTSTWKPPYVGIRSRIFIDNVNDVMEEIELVVELILHFKDKAYQVNASAPSPFLPCEEKKLSPPVIELLNVRRYRLVKNKFFYHTSTGMVYQIYEFRAVVREVLDLRRFPFDRQIFNIRFQSFASELGKWQESVEKPPRVKNDLIWKDHEHIVSFDDVLVVE